MRFFEQGVDQEKMYVFPFEGLSDPWNTFIFESSH